MVKYRRELRSFFVVDDPESDGCNKIHVPAAAGQAELEIYSDTDKDIRTNMKRFTAILMTAVMLAATLAPYTVRNAYAETEPPAIIAEGAIVIDADSGTVLYEKNAYAQMEPASTTKMITCILALENLKLDQLVTIDAETAKTEGSRIYLEEGEKMTVEDLLYALMLESANDAAVALAKEISGSTEAFAKLMNKKAKEIGATTTHFVNPNGLHEEGHTVSAHDLAMIAKYGMQNKEFRKLVSTYRHEMAATNIRPERTETPMYNTNRLLYDTSTKLDINGVIRTPKYEGILGVKTGYTSSAGGCLVAAAKQNGTTLIAVALKSTDLGRFSDCISLLDYGFANYHSAQAVKKGTAVGKVKVKMGAVRKVDAIVADNASITLPIEASSSVVNTKTVLDKKVKAPIKKGQKIGEVEIYEGDTLRTTVDIVAKEAVAKGTILSAVGISNKVAHVIFGILAVLLGLAAALFATRIIVKTKRAKRRRELRERRACEIARQREIRRLDCDSRDWYF